MIQNIDKYDNFTYYTMNFWLTTNLSFMYLLKADTVDCCEMFIFLTELITVVTRQLIDKPVCLNIGVNQYKILCFKIKV